MCKNLIYDILIAPLSLSHCLRDYINIDILTKCALEITECFYRATREFPIFPEFFIMYEPNLCIKGPSTFKDEYQRHEYIWNKFNNEFPRRFSELQYAIDLCFIEGVVRKTCMKEQLITQFFMEKLYIFLANLPQIHNEHILKLNHTIPGSTGPVCLSKLIDIRKKAGLSVTKYLPKNVYQF